MRLSLLLAASLLAATVGAQTAAEVSAYGKAYASAKKALSAKPKDKKLQKAFVVATDRYATATMNAPSLPPRMKYPAALRLYREALKVEPTNREAKNNSDMIVSIYKSMGRPIPK